MGELVRHLLWLASPLGHSRNLPFYANGMVTIPGWE